MKTKVYFTSYQEKQSTLKLLQELGDIVNSQDQTAFLNWFAQYTESNMNPFKAVQNACQCIMSTEIYIDEQMQ